MNSLIVNAKTKTYPIYFSDSFSELASIIAQKDYSKIGVISDSNVFPLHGEELVKVLKTVYEEVYVHLFDAGESNKNIDTITKMYRFCVDKKLDRKSLILALGGGVTGDMAGFLSATFMRGVAYGQVPTSLLAQVDSSVGGKTGIDFMGYKNIVGAFYQPEFVYMNTSTLKTLPQREFASGMGEVIKHGCILDRKYLQTLIDDQAEIQMLNHSDISDMILRSCEIKSDIVSEDEKEHGVRALLNFGHTFGHAIERLCNFSLSHGACVALGVVCASYLSKRLGHISEDDFDLILETIKSYHLPTSVSGMTSDDVYQDMFLDKKTAYNTLKLVLLKEVGAAYITTEVDESLIKEAIDYVIKP